MMKLSHVVWTEVQWVILGELQYLHLHQKGKNATEVLIWMKFNTEKYIYYAICAMSHINHKKHHLQNSTVTTLNL